MEKIDVLEMLRESENMYVIYSISTNMPYVHCDAETYDDEILLFPEEEDAKKQVEKMLKDNIPVRLVNVEKEHRLNFFTGLFGMGVNAMIICVNENEVFRAQLDDLVVRPDEKDLPEDEPRIENPQLHLTALYFVQELRKNPNERTEELEALNEEMLAHFHEGRYLVAAQEDKQIPVLKRNDGKVYQPIFTDLMEFAKFDKERRFRALIMDADMLTEQLAEEIDGVAINPLGVNVLLDISRQPVEE